MYALNNNVSYFDSFVVEHIQKEIKIFIGSENNKGSTITKNIFKIQAYDLVMCGYFCIGFIDFMFADKTLTDFNDFIPPNIKKAPNIYTNLNDQQQFRLNKINDIKDYFVAEIKEKELMSKKVSKCIAFFDYFD